jgi:ubiquinone/menaquinone biosynthesis C-methylase UbiE
MTEMSRFEKSFCTGRIYRWFARRFVLPWALNGFRPIGEALEVGCGSGAMAAQLLRDFPELRLVATDYDAELVAVATRTLNPFTERATVHRVDAAALPFPDNRFDAVLSFAMFHHVADWPRAVDEAVRVLVPGGQLIGYDLSRLKQLEAKLGRLPVQAVRTRRSLGTLLLTFRITK